MPAVAAPEDVVLGVVNNAAPGAVCQVCQLSQATRDFAREARKSGFSYADIAAALTEGIGRPISQKALWHHLNSTCKGTS